MPFQRALAGAEDVLAFPPNNPTDDLPAVAESTDSFFDRHVVFRQRKNRGIDLLAPLITFILQALGGGEQIGVNRRGADGRADLAHRFAHCSEKSATGILHQVPTIGDLGRMRKCTGDSVTVSAATVRGHNANSLMSFEPGCGRRRLTVGQQRYRPAAIEVAHDRSIAVIASPRPVINSNDIERFGRYPGSSAYDTEQGIVAHREHQPSGKPCRRTSARSETEMMNNAIEPPGSPGRWRQNIARKALDKDLPPAQYGVAPKAARNDHKLNASSGQRQIANPTLIPAVHTS